MTNAQTEPLQDQFTDSGDVVPTRLARQPPVTDSPRSKLLFSRLRDKATNLGDDAQTRPLIQQRRSHVSVALPGRQVQRRVPGVGGGVRERSAGEQLLDNVLLAEAARDVQRSLVVLATEKQSGFLFDVGTWRGYFWEVGVTLALASTCAPFWIR